MVELIAAAPPPKMAASGADGDLLECMRMIGKGLIAAGSSVGTVENTLADLAECYGARCEIVALPNILMIKLDDAGTKGNATVDLSVQRLTYLRLDQIAGLMQVIDQAQRGELSLLSASREIDKLLKRSHRFGSPLIILGFLLSCIGLTLQYQPLLRSLLVTGAAGVMVATMVLWFERRPRFGLLLPVLAAVVVSTMVFELAERGAVYGVATLVIPPLVMFLPGAVLTTGMIELASANIMSGSARLMYGAATLFLLYIGIAAGLSLSGLPAGEVYSSTITSFPWWAPFVGTLLFGIGTFIRLSGANRDLLWMLLVLYVAMVGQMIGDQLVSPYFGAFVGALLMTLSSELIGRSPKRTPALASRALAFWFLVPGARGLLGVTSILGKDYQSAAVGIGQMLGLMGAIALGVLLGALIVSPRQFGSPLKGETGRL
jgi:uncharacterized membrane protein YjjP (DUF1212 family)